LWHPLKKAKNGVHFNLAGHHRLKRRCQEGVARTVTKEPLPEMVIVPRAKPAARKMASKAFAPRPRAT
jgi:hypothetical protein